MYDEAADLEMHRAEVETVRNGMRVFGVPDSGYALGVDIGGGYGLHAPQMLDMCERLYVADLTDYVHAFGGVVGKAMADKFERNNIPFDRARVEYHHVDARNTIYRDGLFDLAVSINAFEHIEDPASAFEEMIRITAPGGVVVIQFDPLWNSARGHHLPHLNLEPWQHLTESEDDFEASIRAAGGGEGEVAAFKTAMNRRPLAYYKAMFARLTAGAFERSSLKWWSETPEDEPLSQHSNFAQLTGDGFAPEELYVRGVQFIGLRAPPRRRLFARRS